MIRAAVALLPLALIGAATARDPLAGRTAGSARDCIDLGRVQGPSVQDDGRAILYAENRHRIWRTEPVGACPGLDRFARLVVIVYGNQLCRNDRFTPIAPDSAIPGAQCRFTAFVPYDLPPKAR